MKIKVLGNAGCGSYWFKSNFGVFQAKWGEAHSPKMIEYNAELECSDIITPLQIAQNDNCACLIEYKNGNNHLSGLLCMLEDNIMFFSIGDSILMIEVTSRELFDKYIGRYITLQIKNLTVYDVDI